MRKLLLVLIGVVLGAGTLLAQGNDRAICSLGTLKGVYIFDAIGFAPNAVPKAVVETLTLNGDGTLSSLATVVYGGVTVANNATSTGTYTVNDDCTGTLAFSDGKHFNIYIAPNGKEFHMIQLDAGQTLAGKVVRVGP